MASYPTSVKTFTTKNTGDSIAAAHVNDLQDEVNAVEAGILNGTAPLNSSNSTVAALSVTGGSTFGGAFTMQGALTLSSGVASTVSFASSVTFSSGVSFPSTFTLAQRVRVTRTAAVELPQGVLSGVDWDVETYDPSGMHSTATNSSRITFAASTGVYHVGACISWSTWAGGHRTVYLTLNDNQSQAAAYISSSNTLLATPQSISADVLVTSTADYVTVRAYPESSTGSLIAESTRQPQVFWAHRIG